MIINFVLYSDPDNKKKKLTLMKQFCEVDNDSSYVFVNVNCQMIMDHLEGAAMDNDIKVYLMGGKILEPHVPDGFSIAGYGPSFQAIKEEKQRLKLKKDLCPLSSSCVFVRDETQEKTSVKPQVQKKNKAKPRKEKLPSLEDSIDDAISGAMFLKSTGEDFALPELGTCLSVKKTTETLSYDEFIGLLLTFKRLGNEKLIWKDKEVLSK